MKKRFWALFLAVMMIVSVLPTTAFAKPSDNNNGPSYPGGYPSGGNSYDSAEWVGNESFIKFRIVNGSWNTNNVELSGGAQFTTEETANDTIILTTKWHETTVKGTNQSIKGYALNHDTVAEKMLEGIIKGAGSNYINANKGYTADDVDMLDWKLKNGGLMNQYPGDALSQMTAVGNAVHEYDNLVGVYDVFAPNTEYVLILTKNAYVVTYTDGWEDGVLFDDQVYGNDEGDPLEYDETTPSFEGNLNNCAPSGYQFAGWMPEDGLQPYFDKTVIRDRTYVAQWEKIPDPTYGVTYEFVNEDGTNLPAEVTSKLDTSDINTYKVGVTVTNNAPTTYDAVDVKENNITVGTWTFKGWDKTSKEMVAGGIKFTGTWTYTEAAKYTVTYLIDSAPYGDAESYYAGAAVTVKSAPDNREGYTFSGWDKQDFTMPAENVTITGSWTADAASVTWVVDTQTVDTQRGVTGTAVQNPKYTAPAGYDLDGWYSDAECEQPVTPLTAMLGHITYYGKTVPKTDTAYKVEHYKQNLAGTGYDLAETENKIGTTDTTATATAKTYPGFTFDATVEGTVQSGTIAGGGGLVLKLYYTRNSYTVTYVYKSDVPGQSDLPVPASYKYGASVTVADAATAPGYTFSGWDKQDFTMPAENVTITGSFTANTYDIIYMVDGVEYKRVEDVAYGTTITLIDEPSNTGYTFSGWSTTDVTVTSGMFNMPAKDVTITGSWIANTDTAYTVKHYKQKLDGSGYDLADSEDKTGTTGALTAAVAKSYTGFTAQGFQQQNIAGDGSTVINIYYNRNSNYTVSYRFAGDVPADVKAPEAKAYTFGATVTIEAEPTVPTGYTFSGWKTTSALKSSAQGTFVMPAASVEFVGTWTAIPVLDVDKNLTSHKADEQVQVGETVTWEIVVKNEGAAADTVTLTDSIVGVKIYTTADGEKADELTDWNITIQPATTITYIAEYKVTAEDKGKELINKVTLDDGDDKTKDPEDTSDSVKVENISVEKTVVGATNVKVGDTIKWTIKVTNNGTKDVTISAPVDTLYDAAGNKIADLTAQLQSGDLELAVNESAVFSVSYKVQSTAMLGKQLINKAVVNSVEGTSPSVNVGPTTGVSITKVADDTSVYVGEKVTYTIIVTNTGNVTLTDLVVKDVFTQGGNGETVWTFASLAPGASQKIEFSYRTSNHDVGGLKNIAVVTGKGPDGGEVTDITQSVETDVYREHIVRPTRPALNKEDHYAYIVGYPDGLVHPERNITRAEVSTIFFRMLLDESREDFWAQENWFSDVPADQWYNNAVSTLSNAGLITGYPDGSFKPNANITRAEFATIAIRFFLEEDVEITENNLTDVKGHWAEANINLAYALNLITGYPDNTFRPDQKITRAEAMTIVNRVLERAPHKDHLLDDMIEWPDNMDTEAWYYADVQEATNSHEFYKTEIKGEDEEYEIWTELLPVRDWAALERMWSEANSSKNPGEVVDINISTPEASN